MDYTDEILKKVQQCGMLGYPASKITNILDIENDADINQFNIDFYTTGSIIEKNYRKGVDKAEFAIDIKLFDMAKDGDLKALEKHHERKRSLAKEISAEKSKIH